MNFLLYNRAAILLVAIFLVSYSSVIPPADIKKIQDYNAYELISKKSRSTPIPLPIKGSSPSVDGISLNIELLDLAGKSALDIYRHPSTRNSVIDFFVGLSGSEDVALTTLYYADKYKINPFFTFALMYTESGFNPKATGNNPTSVDRGLFQLNNRSFPLLEDSDFFNVDVNARHGMIHLRWCIDRAQGDLDTALIIYNAGETRRFNPPASTLAYINKIRGIQNRFIAQFKQYIRGTLNKPEGTNNE